MSGRGQSYLWAVPLLSLLGPAAAEHLPPTLNVSVAIDVMYVCYLLPALAAAATLWRAHRLKQRARFRPLPSGVGLAKWLSWLLLLITPFLMYMALWKAFVMSDAIY